MSITSIPEKVRTRLWGKAAGRCEYEGCNTPLWLDTLTKAEFNTAYIAHIIADSPGGPRGDTVLSTELAADISNLMLLCDQHHRFVDLQDVAGHPVERLRAMKLLHERRVEIVTGIAPDKQSHILLYGANIGQHGAPLSYAEAARAMVPERYPADTFPLSLGLRNSSYEDRTAAFWSLEAEHLTSMIERQVRPRLMAGDICHLSVFGLAPQPLLILLGSLLSDIPEADVYQRHREPPGWKWEATPENFEYQVSCPSAVKGAPALVFSLSATIEERRVRAVLGEDVALWRVSIPTPHNDFLRSRQQTLAFRQTMRVLMDRVKREAGDSALLHVFPAMPVCLAVELGRILMPKADLPLRIYDENKTIGGFVHALDVNYNRELRATC